MQPSNLNLEAYFTEKLTWEVVPEFDVGMNVAPVLDCADLEWNVERGEIDGRRAAYRLNLKYDARPEKCPYAWEIAVVGYFAMREDFPSDQMERFMDINAPAILFGATRETLRAALASGPFPVSILPTVHFADASFQKQETSNEPKKERSEANIKARTKRISKRK